MAKRKTIAKKVYTYADGSEGRSFKPGATGLRFDFIGDDGETVTESVAVNPDNYPENIQTATRWHGLAQKLGDAYAGSSKSEKSPFELFEEMNESLMEGTWVAEGESAGPRTTLVLDALLAVVVAAKKLDLAKMGEEKVAELRANLAKSIETKEQKAEALKDKRIAAEYERLRAERAAAKAKAAAEAAAEGGGEDFLASIG